MSNYLESIVSKDKVPPLSNSNLSMITILKKIPTILSLDGYLWLNSLICYFYEKKIISKIIDNTSTDNRNIYIELHTNLLEYCNLLFDIADNGNIRLMKPATDNYKIIGKNINCCLTKVFENPSSTSIDRFTTGPLQHIFLRFEHEINNYMSIEIVNKKNVFSNVQKCNANIKINCKFFAIISVLTILFIFYVVKYSIHDNGTINEISL